MAFILNSHLFGQAGTPTIIPQYPTPNDSIFIITKSTMGPVISEISKSFTLYPGQYSITLQTCYYVDPFWIGSSVNLDTFSIGQLSPGIYTATYKLNLSYDDNNPTICAFNVTSKLTFTFQVTTDVSVAEKNLSDDLKIYPNPFIDVLNLHFPNMNIERLGLYNLIGQKLYEISNPKATEEIDLSFLSSGIYYLKVQNEGGQKVFKIVRE